MISVLPKRITSSRDALWVFYVILAQRRNSDRKQEVCSCIFRWFSCAKNVAKYIYDYTDGEELRASEDEREPSCLIDGNKKIKSAKAHLCGANAGEVEFSSISNVRHFYKVVERKTITFKIMHSLFQGILWMLKQDDNKKRWCLLGFLYKFFKKASSIFKTVQLLIKVYLCHLENIFD